MGSLLEENPDYLLFLLGYGGNTQVSSVVLKIFFLAHAHYSISYVGIGATGAAGVVIVISKLYLKSLSFESCGGGWGNVTSQCRGQHITFVLWSFHNRFSSRVRLLIVSSRFTSFARNIFKYSICLMSTSKKTSRSVRASCIAFQMYRLLLIYLCLI